MDIWHTGKKEYSANFLSWGNLWWNSACSAIKWVHLFLWLGWMSSGSEDWCCCKGEISLLLYLTQVMHFIILLFSPIHWLSRLFVDHWLFVFTFFKLESGMSSYIICCWWHWGLCYFYFPCRLWQSIKHLPCKIVDELLLEWMMLWMTLTLCVVVAEHLLVRWWRFGCHCKWKLFLHPEV